MYEPRRFLLSYVNVPTIPTTTPKTHNIKSYDDIEFVFTGTFDKFVFS